MSEENVKVSKTFVPKNDWVWVLDPLDGTKDFIQGTGNYAMHLALNFKQKPYFGFVLIPDKNQLWITDGKKTWCEKRDGTKFRPNLLNNKNLQEMTLVTSKNHGNEILRNLIQKILILIMIGYGFLILLMELKISSKEQAIMQCIWH